MMKRFRLIMILLVLCHLFLPHENSSAQSIDVGIVKEAPSTPLLVNRQFIYTIRAINFGDQPATNVVVTDELPLGLTLVQAYSSNATCTQINPVVCRIDSLPNDLWLNVVYIYLTVIPTEPLAFPNTARVTHDAVDPNPDDDTSTVTVHVSSEATDLSAMFSSSPDQVVESGKLSYRITVGNSGPLPADGVSLTFDIPDLKLSAFNNATSDKGICSTALNTCVGLDCIAVLVEPIEVNCQIGNLGLGELVTVEISASASRPEGDTLTAYANVSSSMIADSDLSNNAVDTQTLVVQNNPSGKGGGGGGGCFIDTVLP